MSEPNRSFDEAPSRRGLLRLAVAAVLLSGTAAALAQSAHVLDGPRAAGTVGERFDGYAVARGAVAPDLAKLIDQVNAERRAVYTQRAASEHVPVEAVGKVYAAEILKSAPAGTWFLGENGQWTKK
jgi:uncharacterized protein